MVILQNRGEPMEKETLALLEQYNEQDFTVDFEDEANYWSCDLCCCDCGGWDCPCCCGF